VRKERQDEMAELPFDKNEVESEKEFLDFGEAMANLLFDQNKLLKVKVKGILGAFLSVKCTACFKVSMDLHFEEHGYCHTVCLVACLGALTTRQPTPSVFSNKAL